MREALEHYQKHHHREEKREDLSEDDISDLANDRQYLEAIKQEFEKYQDELAK
jgi:hypothetical protein